MTTSIKIMSLLILITLVMSFTCGCLDPITQHVNQKTALDLISPIIVLNGSEQYCKQFPDQCTKPTSIQTTPVPTRNTTQRNVSQSNVTSTKTVTTVTTFRVTPAKTIPALQQQFNPYNGGERWQGQWFKWVWHDTLGCKDINRGIIIYGHHYYSFLKQWDLSYGSYNLTPADKNNKFLAVFVHEEDFGDCDTGLWGYDSDYFWLQYNGELYKPYNNYDKVNRISDLEDNKYDFYHISLMKPFGVQRLYGGSKDNATGGYHVEKSYGIRTGQGNSWDGYIIYQVPKDTTDNDIRIVGKFAGQSVNWRFDMKNATYNTSGMKQ